MFQYINNFMYTVFSIITGKEVLRMLEEIKPMLHVSVKHRKIYWYLA